MVALIDNDYIHHKSVAYYADKLTMTSKRLNEITKISLGKTVSQMIHDRTILEAKRYLSLSENSVKTIAHQLGFEDPYYFIKYFKKNTTLTPTQYRNQYSKIS